MKFKTIINSTIVTVTVVFLTALAFHINARAAADSVAVIKATGMTCGSCASRITGVLEALKGVATTEVDTAGGWVTVGYDTKSVTAEKLAAKIRNAGFSCTVDQITTPEEFKQLTGRELGRKSGGCSGCCGNKDVGCKLDKRS
jgi:copper chaperone CopZ